MSAAIRRLLVGVLGWVACAACRPDSGAPPSLAQFPRTTVTLESASGSHTIAAWVADTPAHRMQGLMFVKKLAPGSGMLFLFGEAQYVAMWMKNTYVALDMVFIDATGHITNIAADARPLSLETLNSEGPVIAVLELPAGAAQRLGLRPGDRAICPPFRL